MVGLACIALAWPAGPAAAADPAAEAAASGPERPGELMLTVQEAGVLAPGEFDLAFRLDNYDRDPLGLDVVDGSFAFRVGVVERLEFHVSYQITRSVSSPGFHPVPSPPLDVVVLGGAAPEHPYRAMYWPMPYLSHDGARVDEMVPGEYTLGLRGGLLSQRGWRPALSASAQFTAPGTKAQYDLSKGSGTGGVDMGLHAEASWRHRRLSVALNLGATLTHDLDPSDRFIVVGSRTAIEDAAIRRPDVLHAGLGVRLRLARGVSAVAELAGWSPVGDRTPMQGESGASDLLGGLMVDVGNATLALGLRWHLRPQPHGVTLATGPLAGAVDLSDVPSAERNALLASLGATQQRPDANLVVTGFPEGMPLPAAAHVVPASYETSTRGNLGVAMRLSLRIGR